MTIEITNEYGEILIAVDGTYELRLTFDGYPRYLMREGSHAAATFLHAKDIVSALAEFSELMVVLQADRPGLQKSYDAFKNISSTKMVELESRIGSVADMFDFGDEEDAFVTLEGFDGETH